MKSVMHDVARGIVIRFLWVALLAMPAGAEEGGKWEPAKSGKGIEVHARPVAGSDVKAFRGETVLPVELNRVMALMLDIDACPDWMHRCADPVLLQRIGLSERYTYMRNRLPWPAGDRELMVHSRIEQDAETRRVVVVLQGVAEEDLPVSARSRLPEDRHGVVVESLNGSWTFIPEDDNRTRAIYEMHVELGGKLPAGLVNSLIVDTPYETLSRMREVVQREKYRCFRPF